MQLVSYATSHGARQLVKLIPGYGQVAGAAFSVTVSYGVTYALGRGVEPLDGAAIRGIVQQVRDREYRFSSLIEAIVASDAFRFRGPQEPHQPNE